MYIYIRLVFFSQMVLQLGGSISKNYSDATHLVMKEPVRTTKFLCCVSTVKHIVTADWLKDSSTQHMFLGIKLICSNICLYIIHI